LTRLVVFHRVLALSAALAVGLAGCTSVAMRDAPLNKPISGNAEQAFAASRPVNRGGNPTAADDVMVGLAFSGVGTRASAFSYGVLSELDKTSVASRSGTRSLLDRVVFVSGVSGGSVLAAYYGLKKRAALDDFRERFLLRNAEQELETSINPINLVRALGGGVNDASQLSNWLSKNLYDGATFADFRRTPGPRIWINASDIYNRTAFVFGEAAFISLCSDLAAYPVADAVAASAAVPIVFKPVVIKTYPNQCSDKLPDWVRRARDNTNAPPMLKAFAEALSRYHEGSMNYVKLLDGGLVDNFGLSGFTIARLSARMPFEPMSPEQAVRLRRFIVVVVDSGRGPSGDWVKSVEGPTGTELVMAAADTAVAASVNAGFTAFERTVQDWQNQLVRWRCGLSAQQRQNLHAPSGWNCRDLKFYVGRIDFEQLGPDRAKALNAVDTRFQLPEDQVDMVIAAGHDALRTDRVFNDFIASIGGGKRRRPIAPPKPESTPVAQAPATTTGQRAAR
jgi:NTE family protein